MTITQIQSQNIRPWCLSVAPMMDWTDRHCRAFHRVATRKTLLYTEMVVDQAVLRGDRNHLLARADGEEPSACQLGGSDPKALSEAARIVEDFGYDEINLNVGCPSDRVQSGRFGACLMAEPALVAACIEKMQNAVSVPVTVKSRIGIDDRDSYEDLLNFIDTVAGVGCETFIVHARKAVLAGLSPKENREIPPLRYELVQRLKSERPDLTIILNGGVLTLAEAAEHLRWADGVMIGRAAYNTPALLLDADHLIETGKDQNFRPDQKPSLAQRKDWVLRYLPYVETQCGLGTPLHRMTRHMIGLFSGLPGARAWRRALSENACGDVGPEELEKALSLVPDAIPDAA